MRRRLVWIQGKAEERWFFSCKVRLSTASSGYDPKIFRMLAEFINPSFSLESATDEGLTLVNEPVILQSALNQIEASLEVSLSPGPSLKSAEQVFSISEADLFGGATTATVDFHLEMQSDFYSSFFADVFIFASIQKRNGDTVLLEPFAETFTPPFQFSGPVFVDITRNITLTKP